MPKISEERRHARRHEVLTAAIAVFSRKGFDATSMADIIAESGTSAGMIYGHFENKTDLIQSVVTELFENSDEALEDISDDIPLAPGELIGAFLREKRADLTWPALLLQVWAASVRIRELHAITDQIGVGIRAIYETHLTAWYLHIGETPDASERRARAEASVCLGICQGFMVQAALFDDFDADAYIAAIPSLLNSGR